MRKRVARRTAAIAMRIMSMMICVCTNCLLRIGHVRALIERCESSATIIIIVMIAVRVAIAATTTTMTMST